jgi:hypothetical protein
MKESKIQDDVRLELGRAPDVLIHRNNIGVAEARGSKIRFGVGGPGGADLIGIFTHANGVGQYLAVEIKTPIGKQSEEQRVFQQLVEKRGGIYVVLRSADEARAWLQQMRDRRAA